MSATSQRRIAAGLIVGLSIAGSPAAFAQQVSVTINGEPLYLNPGPIERTGRVFVPLRGIFERLGAAVVYSSGTINATKGSTTISLQIGSAQATVSGQTQTLDVAPFIVGATTYVPLRFIAQSLGANVGYDNSTRVVAINMPRSMPLPPIRVHRRRCPRRPIRHPPFGCARNGRRPAARLAIALQSSRRSSRGRSTRPACASGSTARTAPCRAAFRRVGSLSSRRRRWRSAAIRSGLPAVVREALPSIVPGRSPSPGRRRPRSPSRSTSRRRTPPSVATSRSPATRSPAGACG